MKLVFSQNYEKIERPPIDQVHHAGQRRPFRWWKARACIPENSAWDKRMQSLDVRIASAVQDEENQMLQNAMAESRVCNTWDPVLEEKNNRERKERKAAMSRAKQQAEQEWMESQRMRVRELRKDMYRHEALE